MSKRVCHNCWASTGGSVGLFILSEVEGQAREKALLGRRALAPGSLEPGEGNREARVRLALPGLYCYIN
jgi:hypothetical protein